MSIFKNATPEPPKPEPRPLSMESHLALKLGITRRQARLLMQDALRSRLGY
jgi:hypothetical protein